MVGTKTDAELLDDIAAGDQGSLALLYERHAQTVFHAALCLTANRDDARDAVQDVFLTLYRKVKSIRSKDNLQAWLRRVAVNSVIDRIRRDRRQVSSDAVDEAASGSSPEKELLERERRTTLLRALARLPEKQRVAVTYRFFLEWDIESISKALAVTPGSTRVTLTRGLKKLRVALAVSLRDAGATSSGLLDETLAQSEKREILARIRNRLASKNTGDPGHRRRHGAWKPVTVAAGALFVVISLIIAFRLSGPAPVVEEQPHGRLEPRRTEFILKTAEGKTIHAYVEFMPDPDVVKAFKGRNDL